LPPLATEEFLMSRQMNLPPTGHKEKKKIPWLLGKMFENRSLHVSGGEEG
jgi:hypothetical protein